MHPVELETALSQMHILVDTREQKTARAIRRYEAFNAPWEYEHLDFGDYSCKTELPSGELLSLSDTVCIERKMSIDELCGCFTRDRDRFSREFERAKAKGAKLVLLIENASWEMIYNGKYQSKMSTNALTASIFAWMARYNCPVLMCKAETSGKLIKDILYRELKEILSKGLYSA